MAKSLPSLILLLSFITTALGYDALLTDDTSVALAGRPKNGGNAATLGITAKRHAMFRFAFANLPSGTDEVQKATLTVFIGNIVKPGSLSLYRIQGDWSESEIPTVSFAPVSGQIAVVSPAAKKAFLRFDVTEIVRAWLDGTETNEGLAIGAATVDSPINLVLDSKENVATGHCARLSIELRTPSPLTQSIKGGWSNSAAYQAGDIVTLLGSSYVATVANTNANPATDQTNWNLLVAKGEKGEPGDKGDKGDTGAQGEPGSAGIRTYTSNTPATEVLALPGVFTMAGTPQVRISIGQGEKALIFLDTVVDNQSTYSPSGTDGNKAAVGYYAADGDPASPTTVSNVQTQFRPAAAMKLPFTGNALASNLAPGDYFVGLTIGDFSNYYPMKVSGGVTVLVFKEM